MTKSAHHHDDEETSVALTRLDARVGVLESGMASIGVKIDALSSMFNASRQTNWASVIGIASLILGIIGGAWVIIDLKSQNALLPVLIQNAISSEDRASNRADLDATVRTLSEEVSSRRSGFAALQQQLTEAEGQHRHRDTAAALQYQHLESLVGMLYQRAGLPVPSPMNFQPAIGRIINTPIPNQ